MAVAGISGPRGERSDPRSFGENPLQPHGGCQAAGHHLPRHALPHGAPRYHVKNLRFRPHTWGRGDQLMQSKFIGALLLLGAAGAFAAPPKFTGSWEAARNAD